MKSSFVSVLCVMFSLCLLTEVSSQEEQGASAVEGALPQASDAASFEVGSLTVGSGFGPAFFASFLVILVSEIGDKTFFIAAVLAMRNPRSTVFAGAMGALGVMTVLSAALGYAVPALLPKWLTHWAAIVLFLVFGFQLLRDAYKHKDGEENSEYEEVVAEVDKKDDIEGGSNNHRADDDDDNQKRSRRQQLFGVLARVLSPIFLKTFTLTFLAEWGDRSQIATIALAAAKNPFGVTVGGICGHSLCTGGAVVFGRMLSRWISERSIGYAGGFLFLFFAFSAIYFGTEA